MTGLDASTDAVKLIDDVRETVRYEAEHEKRRERRIRMTMLVTSLVLSGLAFLGTVLAVVPLATQRGEAASSAVVQDARAQRVLTGREELARANARMASRQLPVVPDPGPDASGDELLIQAARANVLADLPESTVGDLRRELRGRPFLPSVLRSLPDDPGAAGDGTVDVLPGSTVPPEPGSAPGEGDSSDGDGGRAPAPAPARGGPAPAPAPPQRAPAPAPRSPAPAPAPAPAPPPGLLPDVPLVPRLPIVGG